MQAYQTILPDLERHGARLVAVSPMLPDGSLSMADKHALRFDVLSDAGNEVARAYGLVFRFPDELIRVYEESLRILLPEVNGDESWSLPVPGTFVLDRHGVVRWRFVDPDYTRRAEPADVVAAVAAL